MKLRYIFVLMLLISFGSVGAVAFTPGLPMIANFFAISDRTAELTITWYLLGYTIGQLLYGPLANRYGSKNTITICAITEIIGAGCCILAAYINSFDLLIMARIIMALGAGGGLTLALTVSSKLCSVKENTRVMSLLIIAFAITPGMGIFIGGALVSHYGWVSAFYFMLIYGVGILLLSLILPEVFSERKMDALNPKELFYNYSKQFTRPVVFGGLLVGSATCFIYTFAALAPFIAMNIMGVSPQNYGMYNCIPVMGMLLGSLLSSYLTKINTVEKSIWLGLWVSAIGVLLLFIGLLIFRHVTLSLFAPMFIIYIGLSLIFGNASALALSETKDKSNASALMSFINMGSTMVVVMCLSLFSLHNAIILPFLYLAYLVLGIIWFYALTCVA